MAYSTGQIVHYGHCVTFQVHAPAGSAPATSAHEGWELNFGSRCAHHMELRGKRERIGDGDILLFNGLEAHTEVYPEDRGSAMQALVIRSAFLDSLLAEHGVASKELVFDRTRIENDLPLLKSIRTLMQFRGVRDASPVAFDAALAELVLELVTRFGHSHRARLADLRRTGHFPGAIAKARSLISAHAFDEKFGLGELASGVGMSKFHLIKAFRSVMGLTPIRYRNLIRIDHAKRLLARGERSIGEVVTGEKPMSEIAIGELFSLLGYRDLSTFNKAFKRATGQSPSKYRESQ